MGISTHAVVNSETILMPCYKMKSFHIQNQPTGFWQRLKFLFRPWPLTIAYEIQEASNAQNP